MPNNIHSRAFAEMELTSSSSLKFVSYLFLTLAGIALITASAKIQVPFWPVPMTLQTLAIMTIFAGFGMRLGLATILGYLGAGLSGLPVLPDRLLALRISPDLPQASLQVLLLLPSSSVMPLIKA